MIPWCIYSGIFGGCQPQYVSLALQQASKASALPRVINRETGGSCNPQPVICGVVYGYRHGASLDLL